MPNTRVLLWFALAAILFYGYQTWMHDYPPSGARDSAVQTSGGAPGTAATLGDSVPQAASTAAPPATPRLCGRLCRGTRRRGRLRRTAGKHARPRRTRAPRSRCTSSPMCSMCRSI